jgi:tRNA (cmo5U34)-methyltransferase
MSVSTKFNKYAKRYDKSRQKLIPCYSDFYKTIIKIIPFANSTPLAVADLGAGTGLLSKQILKAFPKSNMTLVDISEEMLNVAQSRLSAHSGVEYQVSDYCIRHPSTCLKSSLHFPLSSRGK